METKDLQPITGNDPASQQTTSVAEETKETSQKAEETKRIVVYKKREVYIDIPGGVL